LYVVCSRVALGKSTIVAMIVVDAFNDITISLGLGVSSHNPTASSEFYDDSAVSPLIYPLFCS
jgi:hypothetical protein